MRNTIPQQFRETATEEDWRQLIADHETLSDEDFYKKYRFSWAAVRADAIKRGYYERKRKASSSAPSTTLSPEEPTSFFVSPIQAGQKKIARSVQLTEEIYTRLQSLENENAQYTHSSILNQLLDEALQKYGY